MNLRRLLVLAILATTAVAQTRFVEGKLPTAYERTWGVMLGDLDGDGFVDMYAGNQGTNRVYLGDGNGSFTDGGLGRLPAMNYYGRGDLADLDRDGDLDIVLAGRDGALLNNGRGYFSPGKSRTGKHSTVHAVDVDGDGDLDLVKAGYNARSGLWLNDGKANFTDVSTKRMPFALHQALGSAVGDIDGDGDPDFAIANGHTRGEQNLLYRNDDGKFVDITKTHLPQDSDPSARCIFADFDGDRDLDLFFANGHWNAKTSRLYFNDGKGKFTDVTAQKIPNQLPCHAVAASDVDNDGDLDLILVLWRRADRLFINDGTGKFTDQTQGNFITTAGQTLEIATGDLDNDGDEDIVLPYLPGQNRIYLNQRRHITAPVRPRIGQTYRVDFHAAAGTTQTGPVATVRPFFSFARARRPLKIPMLGVLHLDPAWLLPLPPLVIMGNKGYGSIALPIPNQPRLMGIGLRYQALTVLFRGRQLVRLTAMHEDVITQ